MQLNIHDENGIKVVNVIGRIDAITTAEFESECKGIISQGSIKLLLNLQELEYISSAGLRGILGLLKLTKASSGKIAFCSLQDMVAEVFKVSGFTGMLSIYASQEESLIALSS